MRPNDRLSTLIDRFSLSVTTAACRAANLAVVGADVTAPERVIFTPNSVGLSGQEFLLCAHVNWGAGSNPLLAALPDELSVDLKDDVELHHLVALMGTELRGDRCGANSVVNRLGEVLIVRILRAAITQGSMEQGLVRGLADARLSNAIVAMHDNPGRNWRNQDLADISGLSLSRFYAIFTENMGVTPAEYLRGWRVTLAGQDLAKGARVDRVARRYGYGSAEAFARAYRRHTGQSPIQTRLEQA